MGDFKPSLYKDQFIAELVEFVGAKDFQSTFESFFLKHAMEFSYDDEHKLIYSELYREFAAKFEGFLEDFCNEKGLTHAEFMKKCRDASTEDEKAKHYISILLSSAEYETFVKLMRIMRPAAEARLTTKSQAKDDGETSEKATTHHHHSNEVKDVTPAVATHKRNDSEAKHVSEGKEEEDEK